MRNRVRPLLAILLLLALPAACRRAQPPGPPFPVQANLAQVTESHLLPGETTVTPGQRYLVGAPGAVISFRFPEPMHAGSVAGALAVSPAVPRDTHWAADDVLQLRLPELPPGQPVQVSLGEGARGRSGASALPLAFSILRVEPPRVVASVEGQPGVVSPGMYRLLSGKKCVRLDFTLPMDRPAVEKALLSQVDPRCQPTLRWESDQTAFLELDLLEGVRVETSFLGLPDKRGVPVVDPAPLALEGVGTVRLLAGATPDQPTVLSTLLDQFAEGTVSPDGSRLALLERFPLAESDQVVVWVLDLGSRLLQRLASFTDAGHFALAWMPDSRHLVVNTGRKLVELNSGGGEPRILLEPEAAVIVGMAVAPRSGRVACFVAPKPREAGGVDLIIAGAGSEVNFPSVTRLHSREGFWLPVPCAWAPDETWVAFTDLRSPSEGVVTLIDPEKGGTRLLGGQAEFLAYSPSGAELATRNPDGSWDLVSGDGSRVPLLAAKEECRLIFWSPAGDRACFARTDEGFLLWDRDQAGVTGTAQGIPLGWMKDSVLWIAP